MYELAVIDVSRARLPGQLFVQLLPSSEAYPYITLAAVSLLNHLLTVERCFGLVKFTGIIEAEASYHSFGPQKIHLEHH